MQQPDYEEYRGLRALMLTRVSTQQQGEKYGHASQERVIREKLIKPLGLKLDEERHVIHDTYTGLEYRYREALDAILAMAQRREFDVLCMDVLDRGLGRKGIQREIYRAQLRELGVRILTTDPSEHADDDSLVGEMIRLLNGYNAEKELNDIRRRTMNGKRSKVLGEKDEGHKKILGTGTRLYGYTWRYSEKNKRDGYVLNLEVIYVDADGGVWTEVAVVLFIFKTAAIGIPIRHIAKFLNAQGVPSATGGIWQPSTINHMLRRRAYMGEATMFKTRSLQRVPGKKWTPREKTPEDEQVIVPVPPIVDAALFDAVQNRLTKNKQTAARNNKHPHLSLLRAGLVKCGYCKGNMSFQRDAGYYQGKEGCEADRYRYRCVNAVGSLGKCIGCSIDARQLDAAVWEFAREIIYNPQLVDQKVEALRVPDPTASSREKITKGLAELRRKQRRLQNNLAEEMEKDELDADTIARLKLRLNELADLIKKSDGMLKSEQDFHEKWKTLQARLDELYRFCADMREKMCDPDYIPPYDKKRDACELFGITAIVFRKDHEPPHDIQANPPPIVSFLS